MTELKGTIEAYSEPKGVIKVDGAWYEASGDIAKTIFNNGFIKGYEVSLTLDENGKKFYSYELGKKKATSGTGTNNPKPVSSYKDRGDQIARHGALNTAIELLNLSYRYGGLPQLASADKTTDMMKPETQLKVVCMLADKILEYVRK